MRVRTFTISSRLVWSPVSAAAALGYLGYCLAPGHFHLSRLTRDYGTECIVYYMIVHMVVVNRRKPCCRGVVLSYCDVVDVLANVLAVCSGVMQGKLVEDFASLLKSLWSQEYLCIFPSKFKRGLIKYKPQFAGNEQQDSQVWW